MSLRLSSVLLAVVCLIAGCASNTGIGGVDYAPQYDFSEFYAATNGKTFRVIVSGNPFPDIPQGEMERRLLPVLQASRPQPNLTFTYKAPAEPARPDYRLVLVFDTANDLTAARVCANQTRHQPRRGGNFYVFAVYCRNDLALAQATAWTTASSPEDPSVGQLFTQLFLTLFNPFPLHNRGVFPFMWY
jgi:hypothetical protein